MKRLLPWLLLLLSLPALASNPVQTKVGSWNGSATTAATSFTSLPASGHQVFAWVRVYTGGGTLATPTCADNQTGNTYTNLEWVADQDGPNGYIGVFEDASIGSPTGTFTITCTLASAHQARVDLVETSGLTLDKTGTNAPVTNGTSGTVSGSATNSSSTNFVMAAIEISYNAGSAAPTPTTGYTAFVNDTGFTTFVNTVISYKTETTTVTSSASWASWTSAQYYAAAILTFTGSGGSSCTHSGITSAGAISTPNGSSGSYVGKTGAFVTPDCSTVNYWQPAVGNFGVN